MIQTMGYKQFVKLVQTESLDELERKINIYIAHNDVKMTPIYIGAIDGRIVYVAQIIYRALKKGDLVTGETLEANPQP